ncbi:hypothetical protein OCU04_006204 [Sclerotinia nivalis]|uniref:Uncharacterized protein n=1 Tax=Sclerotinia nivalis TaxID=352851 RepID=A0A9X0DKZ6_9HELO|nr:hypothetical protein OCU04_006204 [Sclerotinia nivalis]
MSGNSNSTRDLRGCILNTDKADAQSMVLCMITSFPFPLQVSESLAASTEDYLQFVDFGQTITPVLPELNIHET